MLLNSAECKSKHYEVGKTVRQAIEELGGTMPEKLPTPNRLIKELEKNNPDS